MQNYFVHLFFFNILYRPAKDVDLQLPSLPEEDYHVPEVVIRKNPITFTEKLVTLSDPKAFSKGPVSFKKRKNATNDQGRNVRERLDE